MKVKAVFTFTLLGAFFASAALSQDVPVVSVINVKTTNPQGYDFVATHKIMSSRRASRWYLTYSQWASLSQSGICVDDFSQRCYRCDLPSAS